MIEISERNKSFSEHVLEENEYDLDGEERCPDGQEQKKVCEFKIDNHQEHNKKRGLSLFDFELKQIKWVNLIFLTWLHIFAVYGYFHALFNPVRFFTGLWVSVLSISSGLGMSVGKQ